MSLKSSIIIYWTLVLTFFIGAFIQNDATAKSDAITWLLMSIFIFLIGVLIYWIKKRNNRS